MELKSSLKHLRVSPRKTRLVTSLIRGLKVSEAIDQLKYSNKRVAKAILKLLNSAVANAVNGYDLDKDNLIIKEIKVDEGKTLKRWMPRAYGRATVIRKRMSHISLVLSEIVDSGKKEAKKLKVDAPVKLDDLSKKGKSEEIKGSVSDDEKKIDDKRASGKGFASKVFRRKAG
jgi:large subunit ribosomal protein L22